MRRSGKKNRNLDRAANKSLRQATVNTEEDIAAARALVELSQKCQEWENGATEEYVISSTDAITIKLRVLRKSKLEFETAATVVKKANRETLSIENPELKERENKGKKSLEGQDILTSILTRKPLVTLSPTNSNLEAVTVKESPAHEMPKIETRTSSIGETVSNDARAKRKDSECIQEDLSEAERIVK